MDLELATSLGQALGSKYELHCPRMPNEEDPDLNAWKKKISSELSLVRGDVLVDGDWWNFDDLKMPGDLGKTLAPISTLFFYHCRDDNTVPFAHLALHQSRIPQAVTRAFDSEGHQFAGEFSSIAADIRGDRAVHRGTPSRG